MPGLSYAFGLGLLVFGPHAEAPLTHPWLLPSPARESPAGRPFEVSGGLVSELDNSLTPLASAPVKPAEGRPQVHLDRLEFPSDVPGSSSLKKHLRRVLQREVRRVEWGAGRENRIEYRFKVTKLELQHREGVLSITCSATGLLPGGKSAKSQLTFGGSANQQNQLLRQVLEIVARGVITRLAELERRRRGLS